MGVLEVQPHYSLQKVSSIEDLKRLFPDGEANDLNFVLFSTSGVHGSYVTIEDIEASLEKYGPDLPEGDTPDDWVNNDLTVVVVQPRICCLRYGNVAVTLNDMEYLKRLRSTSWRAVQTIGE